MSERRWRIAIVDGGLERSVGLTVVGARRFVDDGEKVSESEPSDDFNGHGSTIAAIVGSGVVPVEVVAAQVLDSRGRSTAAAVAAALLWSITQRAALVHLSLGLASDRAVLAEAIGRAISAGVVVIASTPVRGAPSYPAAYPEVIRATGDARCAVDEISHLANAQADFGACPFHAAADRRILRGASVGAAYLTRFIVSHLLPFTPTRAVRESLTRLVAYRGAERRSMRSPDCAASDVPRLA
jgi:hypothetical protein